MDAEAFRADSRDRWEAAAPGWAHDRASMQRDAMEVSRWMLDAAGLQPGHTVLELAAGPGDTGLMAAELVAPGGRAIITDGAEAMVEAAKVRADEVGATNVEVRPMEAEWIDMPTASVDAVLCRWGYMLLADPEAALRETRRVLRPGRARGAGRVGGRRAQPVDHADPRGVPRAGAGRAARAGHARAAGLRRARHGSRSCSTPPDSTTPRSTTLDFAFRASSLDEWWEHSVRTSGTTLRLVAGLSPAEHYALRDAFDEAYAEYVTDEGVAVPARALMAAASA